MFLIPLNKNNLPPSGGRINLIPLHNYVLNEPLQTSFRLGLGTFLKDMIGDEKIKEEDLSDNENNEFTNGIKQEFDDPSENGHYLSDETFHNKSPSAEDFFDINELADDVSTYIHMILLVKPVWTIVLKYCIFSLEVLKNLMNIWEMLQ